MYKPPKVPTFNEIEIKNGRSGKFVNASSGNNSGFFVRDAPWDSKSKFFKYNN
jgi:hypothetical protein